MTTIRTGLTMTPEASGVAPPVYEGLRLTVPAREAIESRASRVEQTAAQPWPLYTVTLNGNLPKGLVLCLIGTGAEQHRGLRMSDEPPYPGEWMQRGAIAWYEHGDWTRCPKCHAPLVWYEAGYVPGYRICTRAPHHHVQLDADGKGAKLVTR